MSMPRPPEAGVILINVLVILALMASVVFAMVSLSDISITRSQLYSEAGQGLELIAAGESSAISALRQDLEESPENDHLLESWAQIQQDEVAIEAGRFTLSIADAQAKLNLNSLSGTGASGMQMLREVLAILDLPHDVALRIAARLAQKTPLARLEELETAAGLTAAEIVRLSDLVTVLPGRTDININTAADELLAVLANNPVQARNLTGIRNRQGFLSRQDIVAAGMILPPGVGFSSRFFTVSVDVVIGGTHQSQVSLLQRHIDRNGRAVVSVVGRQTGY